LCGTQFRLRNGATGTWMFSLQEIRSRTSDASTLSEARSIAREASVAPATTFKQAIRKLRRMDVMELQ